MGRRGFLGRFIKLAATIIFVGLVMIAFVLYTHNEWMMVR